MGVRAKRLRRVTALGTLVCTAAVSGVAAPNLGRADHLGRPATGSTVDTRPSTTRPASAGSPRRAPRGTDVKVRLGGRATGRRVPAGFIGLSTESWALPVYAGSDPSAINPLFVELLDTLAGPGGPSLRIGGNSADQAWTPIAGMQKPGEIQTTLSPNWFALTDAVAREADAHVIFGLNMRVGDDRIAMAEARTLRAHVASKQIAAVEIGNEAEYWASKAHYPRPGYAVENFLRDYERVAAEIAPLPLAGPSTGSLDWLGYVNDLLTREPRIRAVTYHRYPLLRCVQDPSAPLYASIGHLLRPSSSRGLLDGVKPYVTMAHRHGATFRVEELNAVSCGGKPGVSNSFASALWLLDALFSMANTGVDGVNIHVRPDVDSGQLFTFAHSPSGWTASIRPEYYAALMFNQSAPAGSYLLATHTTGAGPLVRAWATLTGTNKHNVLLLNDDAKNSHLVHIRLPRGSAAVCSIERLLAPSLSATHGVSLAGRSFGAAARLEGAPRISTAVNKDGRCNLSLPPASAALVRF